MPIARIRQAYLPCAALFLLPVLAACDAELVTGQGTTDAEQSDTAVPEQAEADPETEVDGNGEAAPTTFTPEVEVDPSGMADRSPATPDETIRIPATNLFPGEAVAVPRIENPYAGDAEAIAAGERHFAAFNCAGCHAPLGGGGMGPPLSDDEWIYGREPAQIYMSIMHGRPDGMPAWASMLPERAVWELVAYIETLSEIENYAEELGFQQDPGFEDEAEDELVDDPS